MSLSNPTLTEEFIWRSQLPSIDNILNNSSSNSGIENDSSASSSLASNGFALEKNLLLSNNRLDDLILNGNRAIEDDVTQPIPDQSKVVGEPNSTWHCAQVVNSKFDPRNKRARFSPFTEIGVPRPMVSFDNPHRADCFMDVSTQDYPLSNALHAQRGFPVLKVERTSEENRVSKPHWANYVEATSSSGNRVVMAEPALYWSPSEEHNVCRNNDGLEVGAVLNSCEEGRSC